VGSALGLVLGTLRLPLILAATGNASAAAGTNIAISAAAAASGGLRHARAGRLDWHVVAWLAPPSVAGGVAGALLGSHVPERALYAVVAAVLCWNGVEIGLRPPPSASGVRRIATAPAAALGFLIGVVGGALGVILGTLRTPVLLRGVGMDIRRAAGTNLTVGFLLGLFAFAARAAKLEVDWPVLAAGLPGGIAGGWVGARWTGLASERLLRRATGAVLFAVGIAFVVEAAV
jgi:uncharacterized membrane protein YfcA